MRFARVVRLVVIAAMCVGVGLVSAGSAQAGGRFSLSDVVSFSGPIDAAGNFTVTGGSLHSDGEHGRVVAQAFGHVTFPSSNSQASGTITVTSSDGQLAVTLSPPTQPPFTVVGSAIETDAPEGGVLPSPNDAIVKGGCSRPIVPGNRIDCFLRIYELPTSP